MPYKNAISAPTWKEFELPDGSCNFEYILKKESYG